jgi:hypothetical protein
MSILEQFGLDELGLFRGEMCPENHPVDGDIRYRATGRCYGCRGRKGMHLKPIEVEVLNPLIEDAGLSAKKYRLVNLCPNGHSWRGSGRTLKYRTCHQCLECSGVNPKPTLTTKDRFLGLMIRDSGADGCWDWQGSKSPKGYGSFRGEGGKTTTAHRYSYQFYKGEIPEGLIVMHTCDNPSCCNPAHLELGTCAANSADMVAKDRQCKGEARPQSKLTLEQVIRIRELGALGIYSREQIREMVGAMHVTPHAIGHVLLRNTWTHVA